MLQRLNILQKLSFLTLIVTFFCTIIFSTTPANALKINIDGSMYDVKLVKIGDKTKTQLVNESLAAGHKITIGTISSSNPFLWVDLFSLGTSTENYKIQTGSPGDIWSDVNQFCSLLSIKWLQKGGGTSSFGLKDVTDAEKISMAEQLISFQSMEAQTQYAVNQLRGSQKSLNEVASGVEGSYPIGTKIWAGNDFHVIGVYLRNATMYEFYEPNTGKINTLSRSEFKKKMEGLKNNVFVVAN